MKVADRKSPVNGSENGDEDDGNEDADDEEEEKPKPTIIVIARSHPGDSNTSYIVQGKLDETFLHYLVNIFINFRHD